MRFAFRRDTGLSVGSLEAQNKQLRLEQSETTTANEMPVGRGYPVSGDCSPKERAKRRAARAEQLYRQGNTMDQIATQLGVSRATISGDLASCSTTEQLRPRIQAWP